MVDVDAILSPIPGDNPAGEDLRYTPVYDEINEARRADDPLDQGVWQHEIKTSDWDQVIKIADEALTQKTKDLQIAAWLTEALTYTQGFEGLGTGLKIILCFLNEYWDTLYPLIEDNDLDFRAGPLGFIGEKLWYPIREAPITEKGVTNGYPWLKWQESRQVGYESDTLNQYGDVDDKKKRTRDEYIEDGKLTAEDFDIAVGLSSKDFYASLSENLVSCAEIFNELDQAVDEKFGLEAPRLSEIRKAIEDCQMVVAKVFKEKQDSEPSPEPEPQSETMTQDQGESQEPEAEVDPMTLSETENIAAIENRPQILVPDTGATEDAVWESAVRILHTDGINKALGLLLEASCSAHSVRQRDRFRLLMAKLCLKADRPDLARPIAEQLHTSIEDLQLERWESPTWIAEVINTLYQCLTSGNPTDDDIGRANMLFQRLCTLDVTKAVTHRK